MGPNLVVFSLVPAQCYARYSAHGGVQFTCRVPHAPRTRLPQGTVRFGTAIGCHSRSSNCKFQFHLTCFLRSSVLMRPWRCDPTLESHNDLPDPFIVSSSFDSTVVQQSSCCLHSQQPLEVNDSVCTECLGADEGGIVLTVHLHQSEAHLLDCLLATECIDVGMLHPARSTLRHHAASCVHPAEGGNRSL